jgi:ubiquinol-cytochrome c reductase cytochrome b subunit
VASVVVIVMMVGTLWLAGVHSDWSPNFHARPLPVSLIGTTNGPVFEGAQLFQSKGCINCHLIGQYGGRRGPDLTTVAQRLGPEQMILRLANGGVNMPAYAGNLTPQEMDDLVAFLQTRQPAKLRD